MSVVLEYSGGDTILIKGPMVLPGVGKCGKSDSSVARHGERRGLSTGEQPPVLGWDVDG